MSTPCPCCGAPLARTAVAISLDTNSVAVGGIGRPAVHLTPQETELAYILWEASPRTVGLDHLISRLYGTEEPGNPKKTIEVVLSGLRRKIVHLGLVVETKSRGGYRLIQSIHKGASFRQIGSIAADVVGKLNAERHSG